MNDPALNNHAYSQLDDSLSIPRKKRDSFWEVFKKNKLGIAALILLVFTIIISVLAPLIAPYDPVS